MTPAETLNRPMRTYADCVRTVIASVERSLAVTTNPHQTSLAGCGGSWRRKRRMAVPDFLIWHCAGCGAPAKGKAKPCGCSTNVGTRDGPNGGREQTWWDDPLPERDELIAVLREAADYMHDFDADGKGTKGKILTILAKVTP